MAPRKRIRIREYSTDTDHFDGYLSDVSVGRIPMTPTQALMEAAPHDEPEESLIETLAEREAIADAIDLLGPRHKWVVEAIFWRGMTLRQLAGELSLSKTHVARLRDEALEELNGLLEGI